MALIIQSDSVGSTSFTASLSSFIMAGATARKALTVYNNTSSNAYLNPGSAASSTVFMVKLPPMAYYEFPVQIYTGAVHAVFDSISTGSLLVRDFS